MLLLLIPIRIRATSVLTIVKASMILLIGSDMEGGSLVAMMAVAIREATRDLLRVLGSMPSGQPRRHLPLARSSRNARDAGTI
jgi:hypothetical protein